MSGCFWHKSKERLSNHFAFGETKWLRLKNKKKKSLLIVFIVEKTNYLVKNKSTSTHQGVEVTRWWWWCLSCVIRRLARGGDPVFEKVWAFSSSPPSAPPWTSQAFNATQSPTHVTPPQILQESRTRHHEMKSALK